VAISNLVRLLELPDEALEMVESGALTEGHGRALLQARDRVEQRRLAREARDRDWSVRETEAMARSATGGPATPARRPNLMPADLVEARRSAEETLSAALGRPVRVRLKRRGGTVEIPFEDLAEMRELAARLAGRLAA
jgi:ParB family chromosome partitioning protein